MVRPSRPAAPTVADVARMAGVSKSTASRVLGGYGSAGAKARRAVEKAAAELGYRPNGFARGMNTGRSGIIAVVHEGIENPVFAVAMRGITDAAADEGVSVMLMNSGGSVDSERAAIDLLLSQRVDGLIVCPADSSDIRHLEHLVRRGIPLVLWERSLANLDAPVVEADSRTMMNAFMDHVIELGHRRIGFISTAPVASRRYEPGDDVGTSYITERLAIMTERQQQAFGRTSADLVRFAVTGTPDDVARMTREIFETASPPTLLLTSDSEIALVALSEIERLGLGIPADVSFATFDDVDWAVLTSPKTTVIAQPTYDMGRVAARTVLRLRNGDTVKTPLTPFPLSIRWRASLAAPTR